jgi:hypothetical protein
LPIISTEFKTGAHAWALAAGQSISKTSLPAGDYRIAYYQKGGTPSVTATGGATVVSTTTAPASADGWALVKKIVHISALTDVIQLSGTAGFVDELRLHPIDARMQTSCFDAFGRTITETDINLRSQFYEYDDKSRINVLRDHDKNILKHYEYKLANN